MPAPTLRTDRLTLTPPAPADLDDEAAMWADPAVYAMIGGRAFTREEVWHRLLRYIGHWQVCGYGTWIVRTHDGAFAGSVGLMDSRRATEPGYEGTPEAGWALMPRAQGHGYALEAMRALLGWADAQGFARTVCIVDPANAASLRLADKLGYRRVTEATYRNAPTLLLERLGP